MKRQTDASDINREIEFHIEETVESLIAAGMDSTAAREEAERRYGDRRRHAAAMQAAHIEANAPHRQFARLCGEAWAELRFAARSLRRSPGYTLTAIVTLALVSSANLTMFGIADGLTYRPLKYLKAPEEVHRVYWQWTASGRRTTSASTQYPRFIDLRDLTGGSRAWTDVAVFAERTVPVGDGDAATQRQVAMVSASYFRFFDGAPVRGRFFTDAEDVVPRGADVAVVGYRYWRNQLGGGDVIGQVLRIDNVRATIVGIAPEGFDGLNDGRPPAAFMPITTYAASTGTTDAKTYFSAYKWGWVHLLVRRAKGVDLESAAAEATRIFVASWPRFRADNSNMPPTEEADPRVVLAGVRPGAGPTAGSESRTAMWLLGIAVVVLFIGCANVANLALSRALGRGAEVGVKRALGVSTRRLVLGIWAEALLIAIGAGLAGLAMAQGLRIALAPIIRSLRLSEISIFSDTRTLLATAAVGLVSAVLTGVIPALFLCRNDVATAHIAPSTGTLKGRRVRASLLAAQAMLSVTLLVAAGLFVRSLVAVQYSSLGYDPSRVLIVNRIIAPGQFDAAQQIALRGELLRTATAHPAVESAAWMSSAPFISTSSTDIHVEGVDNASALGPFTFQATTAAYFETMGTRILRGRGLRSDDTIGTPEVAVVSESMARTLWPGRDALGQCFRMRQLDSPCRTVVGVAEDMVQREIADGPRLHYYVPIDQYPRTFGNGLLLKARHDPHVVSEDVRVALQQVLPAGSYLVVQPLADIVVDQGASWRMGAAIMTGFGLLALAVAGVGLFGSISYDIAQRSREWAIRVALGADHRRIRSIVVGQSIRIVLYGIVPGLFAAAALGRWLQPLLYRTSAKDPIAFSLAAGLMITVAIVASTWPARRAARTDPNGVLRGD